jgi:hypothetical protein
LVVFGMCEGLHLWCSAYLSGLQKSKKVEKLTWTSSPERVGKFIADMLLAFPPVVMGWLSEELLWALTNQLERALIRGKEGPTKPVVHDAWSWLAAARRGMLRSAKLVVPLPERAQRAEREKTYGRADGSGYIEYNAHYLVKIQHHEYSRYEIGQESGRWD